MLIPGKGGYPAGRRLFYLWIQAQAAGREKFLPGKSLNKLLVERLYMSVLIKDDVILAQGR